MSQRRDYEDPRPQGLERHGHTIFTSLVNITCIHLVQSVCTLHFRALIQFVCSGVQASRRDPFCVFYFAYWEAVMIDLMHGQY
jgi:hypothetical protein